ncbi:Protein of unknown function [Roseivivax marinus]|uniref:DUF3253 domain-containing protein n=1 Tax=Roseivivax marinus TaxID=1379903 RepID=UPI0008B4F3C4|nr:DUF3253 domain-containing protein [Roseivivax marinus]SEK30101.1 Protein of unknown function [Roseivivax marinus]
MTPEDDRIAETLMALARARGTDKTFCPSEAARRLSDDWRPLMEDVRLVAATLPLRATRGGTQVDLRDPGGPVRLSLDPDARSRA